jgi:hypothetical protein
MTSQIAGNTKPSKSSRRWLSASSMIPRGIWQMYDWK